MWVSVRAMLAQAGSQRSAAGGNPRGFRRVRSGGRAPWRVVVAGQEPIRVVTPGGLDC